MAFLIFGLFWMTQDHARWPWVVAFCLFQLLESVPDHTHDDRRDYLLREILNKLGGRNVR